MARLRCGLLAAWTPSWVAGHVGPDEVVDAVTGTDGAHQVTGLPGFDDPVGLRDVLVAWRRSGAAVRLVLPVAGDVRGVPGPAEFRTAALEAGEAAFGGGIGLVPEVIEFYPSSAPPTVLWTAVAVGEAPPDHLQLGEAQYDLTVAIRECAGALARADVAGSSDDVTTALADARRASESLDLPPGFPQRAVALLALAERLQAVLDIAEQDPVGAAIDRTGMAARHAALRPLASAVRRARLAGYNAMG